MFDIIASCEVSGRKGGYIKPFFWALQEQRDGRPFQIILLGEASNSRSTPREIRALLDQHQLLEGLPITGWADEDQHTSEADNQGPTNEIVSSVVTADTVLDYRPCRPEDFVGRGELQKDIWGFLEQARADTTSTRLLALVGPSGSGKSSLVAKLASRFRNKKWRNRLFLYPVDVRSARGALFVAEAVLQALQKAAQAGFVSFDAPINIEDAEEVLASSSVSDAVEQLRNGQKLLVIFFDQFEEVFTKEDLLPVFRAFRRFALDVHGKGPPIVVGFSWRTGISLADDNPAYQLWNELRDHRLTQTLGIFNSSESSSLITQFEEVVGEKLLPPLRRSLHEQGQGLPWLLKKLCIHLHRQIKRGESQSELLSARLNVKSLFDEDLEPLCEAQLSCLRYIAGNSPADSLEVYERFGSDVVSTLLDARLALRTGQRFAVYWDIFRDYLTDNKVPTIPWTYIPNCTAGMAIAAAELLASQGPRTSSELAALLGYTEKTIVNIITDLQNVAVVGRTQKSCYQVLDDLDSDGIASRVRTQFAEHVLYEHLANATSDRGLLQRSAGVRIVRQLYSKTNIKPKTRDNYLPRVLSWLDYAGLVEVEGGTIGVFGGDEYGSGFGVRGRRGSRRRRSTFLGTATPDATVSLLRLLSRSTVVDRDKVADAGFRNAAGDLTSLGLALWTTEGLSLARRLEVGDDGNPSAKQTVASAAEATETLRVVREHLSGNQAALGREVGAELAKRLGREWKASSALRYGNGLLRYNEFCQSVRASRRAEAATQATTVGRRQLRNHS